MKHLDPKCDLSILMSEWVNENEVAVICAKPLEDKNEFVQMLRAHKVEFCEVPIEGFDSPFECLSDVRLPAMVLGKQFLLSKDEAICLMNAQPEADTLFFMGIEYNMLWKGQQLINKAKIEAQARIANMNTDTYEEAKKANLLYLPADKQLNVHKADLPY